MMNRILRLLEGRMSRGTVWIGIVVAGLFCACHDRGTDPEKVNHNIYVGVSYYADSTAESRVDNLYVFDADSLTLLDSISLPCPSADMAVSPDGRWLYVTGGWGGLPHDVPTAVRKINAQTSQVEWSHEGGLRLTLLKNGKLLIHGRDILNTADGSPVGRIDESVSPGHGSLSGTKIAAVVNDSSQSQATVTIITVLDVQTGERHGRYVPHLLSGQGLGVYFATLHPNEKHVLAIVSGSQYYSWLVVGDVESGETVLQDRLFSHFGRVAINADGSLAVATDPGQPAIGGTPTGVNIIDFEAMLPLKRFDNLSGLDGYATGQAGFLPGNQQLVTAPPPGMFSGGPFCIIDLQTLTVTDTIWQVEDAWGGALGVGVRQ